MDSTVRWIPTKNGVIRVTECSNKKCRCKKPRRIGYVFKTCLDLEDDKRKIEVICFKREIRRCKKCGAETTAPDPTIPSTFYGKNLVSLIGRWFPTSRTPADITDDIKDLFGEDVSENSVRTCVLARRERPEIVKG